jgi:hypothetical protein
VDVDTFVRKYALYFYPSSADSDNDTKWHLHDYHRWNKLESHTYYDSNSYGGNSIHSLDFIFNDDHDHCLSRLLARIRNLVVDHTWGTWNDHNSPISPHPPLQAKSIRRSRSRSGRDSISSSLACTNALPCLW